MFSSNIFSSFLLRFWFVFDAGSASKTKPKYTNLWYGFGLVLVWFKPEPKPYQNQTDICTHVDMYIIISWCTISFLKNWNANGKWFWQNPKPTVRYWYNVPYTIIDIHTYVDTYRCTHVPTSFRSYLKNYLW